MKALLRRIGLCVLVLSTAGFWLRLGIDALVDQTGVHAWSLRLTWDRYDAEHAPNEHGKVTLIGEPHDLSDAPAPFIPAPDVPVPTPR